MAKITVHNVPLIGEASTPEELVYKLSAAHNDRAGYGMKKRADAAAANNDPKVMYELFTLGSGAVSSSKLMTAASAEATNKWLEAKGSRLRWRKCTH